MLTTTRLVLKQVDVSALDPVAQSVVTTTLAAYGVGPSAAEVDEITAGMAKLFSGVPGTYDDSTARRFAGDRTLPRNRYSTLSGAGASDGQTMLRELSAYLLQCDYPGLVSLFDTVERNTVEVLAVLAEITPRNLAALDWNVPSLLIGLRPIEVDPLLRETYGDARQYVVQIPYRLVERVLDDVLDLRELPARQWMVEQFNGVNRIADDEFPIMPFRDRLDGFHRLLPSLLDQAFGAGAAPGNIAGYLTRKAGANALLYPSARSNASVDVRDGTVVDSAHWCAVVYEGAPEMGIRAAFSVASDSWPTRIGWEPQHGGWPTEPIHVHGAHIDFEHEGLRAGSFAVRGLAEYNRAVYRLAQVTATLRAVDTARGAEVGGRLAYLAIHSTAHAVARLARLLRNCVLGDAASMSGLAATIDRATSDFTRDTYTGALELARETPASFHATGSFAKALALF